ncbi:hypothetical protein ASG38_02165 [Flavobacterium sp. Leaf359]|uniref:competence protein CoiA family protein n=1 Tax=Flavobacterium sp. Leaf359 TaxID=1736351 RepID=UPI0006F40974|nr:hypothetical protein [Flavobacterium sp. Leaf359]KQS53556.1 hypothetical protein ASG38_02165 [Flavobacterium sp. Leaf359]
MKNQMSKHDRIQKEIISACTTAGIQALQEYKGSDWRADVFVPHPVRPVAFEIQLSRQSLSKTLQRQSKYIRDGISACWLFENPLPKLLQERNDLPVFYVEEDKDSSLLVNLGTRKKLPLKTFLENFILDNIQFNREAKTKLNQSVTLVFYEMHCWKCRELNHLYFVDSPFYSSCGAEIHPEEALWDSSSVEYIPEIIQLAKKIAAEHQDLDIRSAVIKERHSYTVDKSYMSFGCYKCDSIFGDFYVMDAKMDQMYGPKELSCSGEIQLDKAIRLEIPHWCFSEDKDYCCK